MYKILRQNPFPFLIWPVVAGLLLWLVWGFTSSKLNTEKQTVEENALKQAASLSRAYAAQLGRTVEQIDQITLSLKVEWEDPGMQVNLERQRAQGLFPESGLMYASIIDAQGNIVTSSLASEARPNLADMGYFQAHKAGREKGLRIDKPELGMRVGRPVIRFSRRLEKPDGSFDGVATVVVEPAYLAAFHDEATLNKGEFISVRFTDGPLLATKVAGNLHQMFYRTNPLFPTPKGVLEEPGEKFADSQPRIVAWQKLDKYPLVALAALTMQEVFAPYNAMAHSYYRIAQGVSFLIIGFTFLGMYLTAHLIRRGQREEEIRNTMRLATDAANEGFYTLRPVVHRNTFITDFIFEDCNERGAELFGSVRQQVKGHRFSEFIPADYRQEVFDMLRRAMDAGFYEDEFRVPHNSRLQAAWVYRRLVRSGSGLAMTIRDISKMKEHEYALSRLANTDALTALPNRHWLTTFLPEALERARIRQGHLAILFIDLDNFKNINDTLGHDAGDELLKSAASRLKASLRASDHVVRLGGDEFMVILEQIDVVDDVSRVASLIVKSIGDPFTIAGTGGNHVNASIGISLYPQDGDDSETLVKHADVAMYAAKAAGKGRYQFYQSHLSDSLILKLNKEAGLRQAIERDEFVLHYQPRVSAQTGKLTSMEALLRWNHPERGLVMPLEFIDTAEDTGLILKIGVLVIEKVCSQLAQWKAQNIALVPVSINVSGLQIQDGNVSSLLSRCIEQHGLDPSLVEVELTESTMIGKGKRVSDELQAIRALGVKLLIDDFGTGYSSLAQLQRLDVDVLKVDRAFTHSLHDGQEGEAFFKAIVSMADALDMSVVAEGVETAEQVRTLQSLSCDEIQGHFISKAVPASEMPPLMSKRFLFAPLLPLSPAVNA